MLLFLLFFYIRRSFEESNVVTVNYEFLITKPISTDLEQALGGALNNEIANVTSQLEDTVNKVLAASNKNITFKWFPTSVLDEQNLEKLETCGSGLDTYTKLADELAVMNPDTSTIAVSGCPLGGLLMANSKDGILYVSRAVYPQVTTQTILFKMSERKTFFESLSIGLLRAANVKENLPCYVEEIVNGDNGLKFEIIITDQAIKDLAEYADASNPNDTSSYLGTNPYSDDLATSGAA